MSRFLVIVTLFLVSRPAAGQTPDKLVPKKPAPEIERIIDNLLAQMDVNKDGKISKDEAKGRLADLFTALDKNKDGFLDRSELRPIAEKRLAQKKGPFPGSSGGPASLDFDALDKNADGRLTRDELKGTALFNRFDEIDANHDGRIDRRKFESFMRKEAEKIK